jgi:hypothetical protein
MLMNNTLTESLLYAILVHFMKKFKENTQSAFQLLQKLCTLCICETKLIAFTSTTIHFSLQPTHHHAPPTTMTMPYQ